MMRSTVDHMIQAWASGKTFGGLFPHPNGDRSITPMMYPRCKKTLDKPDRVVPESTGICPFRYKSTGAPPPWRTSNRTFIVGTPSETWLIVLGKYSLLSQHLTDEIPVIICISPSRFLFENKADDRSGYSAGLVGSIFRGSPWYESFRVLSGVTSSVSTVRGATMDSNCFRVSALGYVHRELRRAGPNNLQRVESTHDDKPQRSWASALFRLSLVFCPPRWLAVSLQIFNPPVSGSRKG